MWITGPDLATRHVDHPVPLTQTGLHCWQGCLCTAMHAPAAGRNCEWQRQENTKKVWPEWKALLINDGSTLFLFALGNESTPVTSKYCEVVKIYTRPVSFHFPMQTKKCTSILIFMLKRQITPKSQKINVYFFVKWPVSFIGKYLPRFSYASSQANDIGV